MADTTTIASSTVESELSQLYTDLLSINTDKWLPILGIRVRKMTNDLKDAAHGTEMASLKSASVGNSSLGQSHQSSEHGGASTNDASNSVAEKDGGASTNDASNSVAEKAPDYRAMEARILAYMGIEALQKEVHAQDSPQNRSRKGLMMHNIDVYNKSAKKDLTDKQKKQIASALMGVLDYPLAPKRHCISWPVTLSPEMTPKVLMR